VTPGSRPAQARPRHIFPVRAGHVSIMQLLIDGFGRVAKCCSNGARRGVESRCGPAGGLHHIPAGEHRFSGKLQMDDQSILVAAAGCLARRHRRHQARQRCLFFSAGSIERRYRYVEGHRRFSFVIILVKFRRSCSPFNHAIHTAQGPLRNSSERVNDLASAGISDTPFARHEYLRQWWTTRGGGEWTAAELVLASATEAGQLIGVAPLFAADHEGRKELLLVGSIEISDYLDLLVKADDVRASFLHCLIF